MLNRLCAFACLIALSAAPASAQQLTQAERDALVAHLQQTRDAFLKSIDGLSEAQWTFKAAPDRWSIAETAEHITLSEGFIFSMISDKILKGPTLPAGAAAMPNDKLIAELSDRSRRFQAPEMLQPTTKKWASREALVKDFTSARSKTIDYAKTTSDPLHAHGAPHPVYKTLDAYQWVLLLSAHAARHTAQIEEVKASSGYPK